MTEKSCETKCSDSKCEHTEADKVIFAEVIGCPLCHSTWLQQKAKSELKAKVLEMIGIENLKKTIEFRDTNKDWLATLRKNDTNKYYWFWGGERNIYVGRLEALEQLKKKVEEI